MMQAFQITQDLKEIPRPAKIRALLKSVPAEYVNPNPEQMPPDPEEMNDRRAHAALRAVLFFAADFGEGWDAEYEPEDRAQLLKQNAMDFLADFAHLCDRMGWKLSDLLKAGEDHYNEETDRQGKQFTSTIPLFGPVQTLDDYHAMEWVLDCAMDERSNYQQDGNPSIDYGDEWPEVARTMAQHCRRIPALAQAHGLTDIRWNDLAENLEASAKEYEAENGETCATCGKVLDVIDANADETICAECRAKQLCECGRKPQDCATFEDPTAQHGDRQ